MTRGEIEQTLGDFKGRLRVVSILWFYMMTRNLECHTRLETVV